MDAANAASEADHERGPLGLIAAGGRLPLDVAKAARSGGRRVFVLAVKGHADPAIEAFPHAWVGIGQIGRCLSLLRANSVKDVVLIGGIQKPHLLSIRFDWAVLGIVPRLLRTWRGGDDHLLSGVLDYLEDKGFNPVGAHQVAPELVAPLGLLTPSRGPNTGEKADIAFGRKCLTALSPFDVGQALVVHDRRVLAIEAAEGTDRMLKRIAGLRKAKALALKGIAGVLVKTPKAGQDLRADMPAIGPDTVEHAKTAGLAGIAVEAGRVLMADPQAVVAAAEKAGLFLVGVAAEPEEGGR
ncbi:MAG: UDP-2,3-diacylglucosamine diphosphatase LpxI [Hyphomicrobiales bacterium]|nr:UDP-2,3-diacylglucosamine diphosphatase LpxI [Hyphomicrobiales bacterium]